jgi:ubiquinol-cytochrome c reductase cytochrome b subunit
MLRKTKTNPYLNLANEYLIDSPAPVNINYLYNFGSLLGINLVLLIATGIALSMHYNPSVDLAFISSEHILRDVNMGWALRATHANGVSMFFILCYSHMARGLYYGSYKAPRTTLWIVGVIIFIVMMAKLLAKMNLLESDPKRVPDKSQAYAAKSINNNLVGERSTPSGPIAY